MEYREIGIVDKKGKWKRFMIPSKEITDYENRDSETEYHLSVLTYLEPNIESNGYCKTIILDVDDRSYLEILLSKELVKNNFILYDSGRNYHIEIPNYWDIDKNAIKKGYALATLKEWFGNYVDLQPYASTRGMIRGYRSFNKKTNTQKYMLQNVGDVTIKIPKDKKLSLLKPIKPEPNIAETNVANNKFLCIQEILKKNAEDYIGQRHPLLLRLVSHFRQQLGTIPNCKTIAWDTIEKWNNDSLSAKELNDKFNYFWDKGYIYGCRDPLLKSYCNGKCPFYKKPIKVDKPDMVNKIIDFNKNVMPFGVSMKKVFHSMSNNFMLYPGHIIVLAGSPASFKTTIALYIAQILQQKTVFFANDESDVEIYMRGLAQLWGKSTIKMNKILQNADSEEIKRLTNPLSNIRFEEEKNQDRIRDIILIEKPRLVIFDHLELIDAADGYAGIRERTMYVRSIIKDIKDDAKTTFIGLSHQTRSSALAGQTSMHTVKGHELEREGEAVWWLKKDYEDEKIVRLKFFCNEKHRNNPGFNILLEVPLDSFRPKEIENNGHIIKKQLGLMESSTNKVISQARTKQYL